MAIYYDLVTTTSSTATSVDNIFTVISKYTGGRFTHTSGTNYIRVEDTFDIVFGRSNSRLTIDGVDTDISDATYTVLLYMSATVFYFLFKTNNVANTPVGGFCWIKERDVNFLGVSKYEVSNGQIDSMNFSDMGSNPKNTYYTLRKHAQFSLISPNILFITTSIIGDNGGNFMTLSELRSCSTVEFGTMIAINHTNYYAIGTNTLIRDTGGT